MKPGDIKKISVHSIPYQPLFDLTIIHNHPTFPFAPLTFGRFALEASVNLPRDECNGISITFTMCATQELLLPRNMPVLMDAETIW